MEIVSISRRNKWEVASRQSMACRKEWTEAMTLRVGVLAPRACISPLIVSMGTMVATMSVYVVVAVATMGGVDGWRR